MASRAYRAGSASTDTPTDLVGIHAVIAANAYSTFHLPAGSAYEVPAGKTLYITKLQWHNANVADHLIIGYGDDAVADSVNPPTNAVEIARGYVNTVTYTLYTVDTWIAVPAGKFPYIQVVTPTCRCTALGIVI